MAASLSSWGFTATSTAALNSPCVIIATPENALPRMGALEKHLIGREGSIGSLLANQKMKTNAE
jgi:hypothetical protein